MGLQVEGVPEQVQPFSTWQIAEHPSLGLAFPSSQVSPAPSMTPFPQAKVQVEGSPEQVYAGSTWHVPEHPSPGAVPPSSQPSEPRTRPSPQTGLHVEG
jgi:hypothetical protein